MFVGVNIGGLYDGNIEVYSEVVDVVGRGFCWRDYVFGDDENFW